MSNFPMMVYKVPGKHQLPHGTFDYEQVDDETQLDAALDSGWHISLADAINPPEVDDGGAPTREELEAKATELGIKFDGRTGDKKLNQLIESKLAGE